MARSKNNTASEEIDSAPIRVKATGNRHDGSTTRNARSSIQNGAVRRSAPVAKRTMPEEEDALRDAESDAASRARENDPEEKRDHRKPAR